MEARFVFNDAPGTGPGTLHRESLSPGILLRYPEFTSLSGINNARVHAILTPVFPPGMNCLAPVDLIHTGCSAWSIHIVPGYLSVRIKPLDKCTSDKTTHIPFCALHNCPALPFYNDINTLMRFNNT